MTGETLSNLKRIINNPSLLYKVITKNIANKKIENLFINTIFSDEEEFLSYNMEIEESGIINELDQNKRIFQESVKGKTARGCNYGFGAIDVKDCKKIYSIVRKFKPQILVETGVCNGFSTAFILLALHKNDKGKLYSIDYPEIEGMEYERGTFWNGKRGAVIPKDKEPGWIIPQYLKNRWELIIGKSQDELPPLLKKLKKIDFFMHDSEHSYECMWFEFNQAFKVLNQGGAFISDDIIWNKAFYNFCKKINKKPINISKNIGLVFK